MIKRARKEKRVTSGYIKETNKQRKKNLTFLLLHNHHHSCRCVIHAKFTCVTVTHTHTLEIDKRSTKKME